MAVQGLIEGRNVHFILKSGPNAGKHRPAIVSQVENSVTGVVSLTVFNITQDGFSGPVSQLEHIALDEKRSTPGTWHYIEPA